MNIIEYVIDNIHSMTNIIPIFIEDIKTRVWILRSKSGNGKFGNRNSIEFSRYSKYNPIIRMNINNIVDTMIKGMGIIIIKRISRIILV